MTSRRGEWSQEELAAQEWDRRWRERLAIAEKPTNEETRKRLRRKGGGERKRARRGSEDSNSSAETSGSPPNERNEEEEEEELSGVRAARRRALEKTRADDGERKSSHRRYFSRREEEDNSASVKAAKEERKNDEDNLKEEGLEDGPPPDPRNPLQAAYDRRQCYQGNRRNRRPFSVQGQERGERHFRWEHDKFSNDYEDDYGGVYDSKAPAYDTRKGAWKLKAGGLYLPPSPTDDNDDEAQNKK